MKKITIQELLVNRGLDINSKTKMVRHKDTRGNLYDKYRYDKPSFLDYQSQQGKNIFDNTDYIISFLGESGTLSRFLGVYKITGVKKFEKTQTGVDGLPYNYFYSMEEVVGFEDMKERVIIDWGKGAIQWCQSYRLEKEIVQITAGLNYRQFTDYYELILDFQELKEIIMKAYPDWRKMLSATNGIYLIQDRKSGLQYVGSAYGSDGIWGRWSTYVKTNGRGGNSGLDELINKDSSYANHFLFSILMLLPKTITPDEAIKKENLFKDKLGTRAHGLNHN
ncbi:MAG: GIY-YIG nuclease family protein [Crocinitomicaceae bacterium]|nr:GIY-YIG nuclease family protein [Crocinitomicaceae bacterium]